MEKIRSRCGYSNGVEVNAEGSSGGLCLAWKESISVSLDSFLKYHIDTTIIETNDGDSWRFTGFYGSTFLTLKQES